MLRAETELAKGAEILLVDYDAERDAFTAEPMGELLADEKRTD